MLHAQCAVVLQPPRKWQQCGKDPARPQQARRRQPPPVWKMGRCWCKMHSRLEAARSGPSATASSQICMCVCVCVCVCASSPVAP